MLSTQPTDFSKLDSIIEKYKTLFHKQSVNIILSHHFIRFIVLPWQEHIFKTQDWQAIAQHGFKKEFGSMANEWQTSVHFFGFGKPVLATAIDKVVIRQLDDVAKKIGFTLAKISPLLNACWISQRTDDWLLIAEPEKLLLIQMQNGICRQLLLDVPPAGHEQQHSSHLVQRAMIQLPQKMHPKRVLAFVSGELLSAWQNESELITRIHPHAKSQPHASWMANLVIENLL